MSHTPGFTADRSLTRSGRHYGNLARGGRAGAYSVFAQQKGDAATCCGIICPDRCICTHGHADCIPITLPPGGSRTPYVVKAASYPFDICRSGDDQRICACDCGCIASQHDCQCLDCISSPAPSPYIYI